MINNAQQHTVDVRLATMQQFNNLVRKGAALATLLSKLEKTYPFFITLQIKHHMVAAGFGITHDDVVHEK
jgi:hypothetical protein